MRHLRNRKGGRYQERTIAGRLLRCPRIGVRGKAHNDKAGTGVTFSMLLFLGLLSVSLTDISWTQTLNSSQDEQYIQLKRTIADMELWQGEIPTSLIQADKSIRKAWMGGDAETTVSLIHQAQEIADSYKRWSVFGGGPIDDIGEAEDLLTIALSEEQVVIDPPHPALALTTGVPELFRMTVTNRTTHAETVTIDAPELFRAGRTITVAPGATSKCVWLFRTLEVFPYQANLNIETDGNIGSFPISVIPEVDKRRPLLGFSIHIPGYGRYNRIRPGGKQKPSPEEMKRHPELYRPTKLREISPEEQEEVRIHYLSLRTQPSMIYRLPGDWDFLELQPGQYSWEYIDSNIDDIRNLTKTLPVLYLGYQPWWVQDTQNPNGKQGFRDLRNQNLMNKYRQYIRTVAQHTGERVPMYELWNEPVIYWFYDGASVPSGPKYVAEYGDMLSTVINISVQELRENAPGCWLISPGFVDEDMVSAEWSMLKYLLRRKVFDQVDALCVHKYPYGVDAAPPPGRSFYPWIDLDYRTDESELLKTLENNGKGDMPLWCTEAGGFGEGRLDGLADLHVGSIMAHQGFCGLHFTSLPVTLNLLSEAITGATPVEWGPCKKTDSDYSGVVIKTFTRGPEDIIILWNNSDQTRTISFVPPSGTSVRELLMVQDISEPLGGPAHRMVMISSEDLGNFFQKPMRISPMEWKALLVIPAKGAGFGWLSRIQGVGPDPDYTDIESLWKEMKTFRREIFSGDIGSIDDQRAMKQAFGRFSKAWGNGQVSEAKGALQDMVEVGRRLGK